MLKATMTANFEDDRGTITDLISAKVDAVTLVRSNAGAIRGNHLHQNTTQWAYVLSGRLKIVTPDETVIAEAGDLVRNEMGEPHAWEALEDTVCVVFVQGPRAGDAYESDTVRLENPLISQSGGRLFHWYDGYSEPENNAVPPAGAVALCGHVREENVSDEGRDMRRVDEQSCLTCVRLRLGPVADEFTDDELREELGDV